MNSDIRPIFKIIISAIRDVEPKDQSRAAKAALLSLRDDTPDIKAQVQQAIREFTQKPNAVAKSDEERERLNRTLDSIRLFKDFLNHTDTERNQLVEALKEKRFGVSQVIYRAGEPWKHFYLIERGHVEVRDTESKKVTVLGPSDYFGDTALMFLDSILDTYISSIDAAVLWELDAENFHPLIGLRLNKIHKQSQLVLRQSALFRVLSPARLALVAEKMGLLCFEEGQEIIQKRGNVDRIYFIGEGKVEIIGGEGGSQPRTIDALSCFGVLPFLQCCHSEVTCRAATKTRCFFVTGETFDNFIRPMWTESDLTAFIERLKSSGVE